MKTDTATHDVAGDSLPTPHNWNKAVGLFYHAPLETLFSSSHYAGTNETGWHYSASFTREGNQVRLTLTPYKVHPVTYQPVPHTHLRRWRWVHHSRDLTPKKGGAL